LKLLYDSGVARRVDLGHARQRNDAEGHRQPSPPRETITSTANPVVKRIRALQQRKERDETGLFFAEGIRIVAEALESGADVDTLVVAPDRLTSAFARETVAAARAHGTPVLEVSGAVFESLSRKEGPQGLAAVLRQRWHPLERVTLAGAAWWVALDAPQDPGNVGTILRTCDAVGAEGVVLVGSSADPYDPAALRASMGAAFTVKLARAAWPEFRRWIERERVPLVGAAGASATRYRDAAYPPRLVLFMGSEREGLSAEQQAACETLVSIPMAGKADSLNLAVATGVLLYEVFHQRQAEHPRAGQR
jgi:RNA methyltransferase, TrmH family